MFSETRCSVARTARLVSFTLIVAALLAGAAAHAIDEAGETIRASVSSAPANEQGNAMSFIAAISADGRFVAFPSSASNLVPDDTNGTSDLFVRDLHTGQTTRVSVSSDGQQSNGGAGKAALSADGRYVAFSSTATNLVPNDTNGTTDVFVHDRKTGETTRVSVSSTGEQGNGPSHTPTISADGRFIAFESAATTLVAGDTNQVWDIFVHDRVTGETTRVDVSSSGSQSDADSRFASISADGRYISFTSQAHNLVPGPTNFRTDVYVRDRLMGTTERISVAFNGGLGNDNSYASAISADGRYVTFSSHAGNLVPNDMTASEDVFLRDRQIGTTRLVSVSFSGVQGNSWSFWPTISGDGRYVAFVSDASNLVPGDTNGWRDVFIHATQGSGGGETFRVSVSSSGVQGNDRSGFFSGPSLSFDGRFVAFESFASNLVEGDTNNVVDTFVRDRSPVSCAFADLNCDDVVDVLDMLLLFAAWGKCPVKGSCAADLNGDNTVDVLDMLLLFANWG